MKQDKPTKNSRIMRLRADDNIILLTYCTVSVPLNSNFAGLKSLFLTFPIDNILI
jgi:hypothetical protein